MPVIPPEAGIPPPLVLCVRPLLSEGGKVTMPVQEQFWGSYFGACTDKFGINWQFDYEMPQE